MSNNSTVSSASGTVTGSNKPLSGIPRPKLTVKTSDGNTSKPLGLSKKTSMLWRTAVGKRPVPNSRSPTSPRTPNSIDSGSNSFSFQSAVKINQQREQEKEYVRSLEKQVKSLKQKHEEEKKQSQNLRTQVEQLRSEQKAISLRYQTAHESAQKLGQELKKTTEQLEKSQREQGHLDDRCHQLELRASGVDQTEIALQTTNKALENSQFRLREQERRLGQLTEEHGAATTNLEKAQTRIKYLEGRVDDLNYQVMQELIKNEKIEKKIEGVPLLEDAIQELENLVRKQEKEIEDKCALLTASRKAVREYKEKIRSQENRRREVEEMKEELYLCKSEVKTLKKLLVGKDVLVLQKSQAVDFAKDVIRTLQLNTENDNVEKVQQLIERSCMILSSQSSTGNSTLSLSSTIRSASPDSEFLLTNGGRASPSQKNRPWTAAAGKIGSKQIQNHHGNAVGNSENGILERLLLEGNCKENSHHLAPSPRSNHNGTAAGTCIKRPSTSHGAYSREAWGWNQPRKLIHRNEEQNRMRYRPSNDKIYDTEETESSTVYHMANSEDNINNVTPSQLKVSNIMNRLVNKKILAKKCTQFAPCQDDAILSIFIDVGDRVFVKFPQSFIPQKSLKNPMLQRYGKRKAIREKHYCGIVKYKGPIERDVPDSRIYVGINLDEPAGDTDGKVRDKSYMFTTLDHGKFLRIINVVSVFDVPSSRYVELSALKKCYLQQKNHSQSL